jgi:hypothetical protein
MQCWPQFLLVLCFFQARPSSDAEDGPTTLSYVWGTNINVPDVTNAIARFLQNYRTSPEDMEAKYIQLIEQVGFGILLQSIGTNQLLPVRFCNSARNH